jgi:hypothetical protein
MGRACVLLHSSITAASQPPANNDGIKGVTKKQALESLVPGSRRPREACDASWGPHSGLTYLKI